MSFLHPTFWPCGGTGPNAGRDRRPNPQKRRSHRASVFNGWPAAGRRRGPQNGLAL